ncbi:MAG: hypothetical protein E7612_09145 [Ruminococcaceae bacterium]|nr:hypothetical protein [Oscillospiraceae bacterium]
MQEFKEKAQSLIDKYSPQLSKNGLKIRISNRYFETDVHERWGSHGEGQQIFNIIDRAIDHKKEKKKYYYQKNRYHTIVLTLMPENDTVPLEMCRNYAFVIKKTERSHIGEEPRKIAYKEEKLLSKIEKQLQKVVKRASNNNAEKVCKDTVFDALRYSLLVKYQYKKRILGKSATFFHGLFFALSAFLAIALVIFLWIVSA